MQNQIIQTGKVVKAPETKHFQSGAKVVEFSISVSNGKKKGTNEYNPSNWWDIKAWGYAAQGADTLKEGQYVEVVGKVRTDEWEDRNSGQKRSRKTIQADSIVLVKYLPRDEQQSKPAQESESNYDDIPF